MRRKKSLGHKQATKINEQKSDEIDRKIKQKVNLICNSVNCNTVLLLYYYFYSN